MTLCKYAGSTFQTLRRMNWKDAFVIFGCYTWSFLRIIAFIFFSFGAAVAVAWLIFAIPLLIFSPEKGGLALVVVFWLFIWAIIAAGCVLWGATKAHAQVMISKYRRRK